MNTTDTPPVATCGRLNAGLTPTRTRHAHRPSAANDPFSGSQAGSANLADVAGIRWLQRPQEVTVNTDYTLRESHRKERAFHAMIAGAGVAGAGCFLPWIQSPFGSLSGMSLRPGQLAVLVSAICFGALLLARERSAKPAAVLAVTVVSTIAAVLGVIGIMKIQSIGSRWGLGWPWRWSVPDRARLRLRRSWRCDHPPQPPRVTPSARMGTVFRGCPSARSRRFGGPTRSSPPPRSAGLGTCLGLPDGLHGRERRGLV